jgi:hypothetical protein
MCDGSEAAALMGHGQGRAGQALLKSEQINRFLGRVNGALNLYLDLRDDF